MEKNKVVKDMFSVIIFLFSASCRMTLMEIKELVAGLQSLSNKSVMDSMCPWTTYALLQRERIRL